MGWKAAAIAFTAMIGICRKALAWGRKGYAVIAEIAQQRLGRKACDACLKMPDQPAACR